jgi:hypothetical protein
MKEYKRVLRCLHFCLLEIRSTEKLSVAKAYSDILHNVPNQMARSLSEEEIVAGILKRSSLYSIHDHMASLLGPEKE